MDLKLGLVLLPLFFVLSACGRSHEVGDPAFDSDGGLFDPSLSGCEAFDASGNGQSVVFVDQTPIVFLSDGTLVRELGGFGAAIESNERIITREGQRLFILYPQSGNETTLARLASNGPIELFALEERDELVVAQGCQEPGSENNDLGPIHNWPLSVVALPSQRFAMGGS